MGECLMGFEWNLSGVWVDRERKMRCNRDFRRSHVCAGGARGVHVMIQWRREGACNRREGSESGLRERRGNPTRANVVHPCGAIWFVHLVAWRLTRLGFDSARLRFGSARLTDVACATCHRLIGPFKFCVLNLETTISSSY